MKPLKIYPKNKEHFKELIPFAKRILKMCNKNKIPSVIYGSFVHFYHTKDKAMRVNDIDILIQEKNISKIAGELKKHNIKFGFYPYGIIVKNKKLKVEIDKLDKKHSSKNSSFFKNIKKIDFYGVKTNALSLKQIEDIYKTARPRTKDNKLKIRKEIKSLENFLGRSIK